MDLGRGRAAPYDAIRTIEEPNTCREPRLARLTCGLLADRRAARRSGIAQTTPSRAVLPAGMGEAIDRDVARLRAATERLRVSDRRVAAGYAPETNCVQHQPHGAMGIHFNNMALRDATLDVEKPEVLVYEKGPDGTLHLNGVEFLVPFTAWTKDEAADHHGPEAEAGRRARLLVSPRLELDGRSLRPVRRLEPRREVLTRVGRAAPARGLGRRAAGRA